LNSATKTLFLYFLLIFIPYIGRKTAKCISGLDFFSREFSFCATEASSAIVLQVLQQFCHESECGGFIFAFITATPAQPQAT